MACRDILGLKSQRPGGPTGNGFDHGVNVSATGFHSAREQATTEPAVPTLVLLLFTSRAQEDAVNFRSVEETPLYPGY